MRTLMLILLVLLALPAYASVPLPQPVWITAAAPPDASSVFVTITGPGVQETVGLWAFPLTGFEALPVQFAPVSRRPGGWAAVDWLPAGTYQATPTWIDVNGAAHAGGAGTLTVP